MPITIKPLTPTETTDKRVKFFMDLSKIMVVLTIAVGGGTASIFLKETKTDLDMIMLALGSMLTISFFFGLAVFLYDAYKNLNKLP